MWGIEATYSTRWKAPNAMGTNTNLYVMYAATQITIGQNRTATTSRITEAVTKHASHRRICIGLCCLSSLSDTHRPASVDHASRTHIEFASGRSDPATGCEGSLYAAQDAVWNCWAAN